MRLVGLAERDVVVRDRLLVVARSERDPVLAAEVGLVEVQASGDRQAHHVALDGVRAAVALAHRARLVVHEGVEEDHRRGGLGRARRVVGVVALDAEPGDVELADVDRAIAELHLVELLVEAGAQLLGEHEGDLGARCLDVLQRDLPPDVRVDVEGAGVGGLLAGRLLGRVGVVHGSSAGERKTRPRGRNGST